MNTRNQCNPVHKGNIWSHRRCSVTGAMPCEDEYVAKEIDGGPWMELIKTATRLWWKILSKMTFLQQIFTKAGWISVVQRLIDGSLCFQMHCSYSGWHWNCTSGMSITSRVMHRWATHGTAPKYAESRQSESRVSNPFGAWWCWNTWAGARGWLIWL